MSKHKSFSIIVPKSVAITIFETHHICGRARRKQIGYVPKDDMCPIHAAHGVNDFDPFFLTTQNLFTARTPQTIWIVPEDDMCVRRDTLQIFSR